MKVYMVTGTSYLRQRTGYTGLGSWETWLVAIYPDKIMATSHAKKAASFYRRLKRTQDNPFDQPGNKNRGRRLGDTCYKTVEADFYRHFDEFQEEQKLV